MPGATCEGAACEGATGQRAAARAVACARRTSAPVALAPGTFALPHLALRTWHPRTLALRAPRHQALRTRHCNFLEHRYHWNHRERLRRVLPPARNLPLSEERRPPGADRRSGVRAGLRLGAAGRAVEGGLQRHRSILRALRQRRGGAAGRCGSSSARPTSSTRSTNGGAPSASFTATGRRRRSRRRASPRSRRISSAPSRG